MIGEVKEKLKPNEYKIDLDRHVPMGLHYKVLGLISERGGMTYEAIKKHFELNYPNDIKYLSNSLSILINCGRVSTVSGYDTYDFLYCISSKELTSFYI